MLFIKCGYFKEFQCITSVSYFALIVFCIIPYTFLLIVKKKFLSDFFFLQAHGRAGTWEPVHNAGQQPVHHQPAEEPTGKSSEGAHVAASVQQSGQSSSEPQHRCSNSGWVRAGDRPTLSKSNANILACDQKQHFSGIFTTVALAGFWCSSQMNSHLILSAHNSLESELENLRDALLKTKLESTSPQPNGNSPSE